MMLYHVFRVTLTQFEIIGGIVLFVSISMMYHSSLHNWLSNNRLHDNNMLKNISFAVGPWVIRQKDFSISLLEHIGFAAVIRGTFPRAVLSNFAVIMEGSKAMAASVVRFSSTVRNIFRITVMRLAITSSKVNALTTINCAVAFFTNLLRLVFKGFSPLPVPVASRRAERLASIFHVGFAAEKSTRAICAFVLCHSGMNLSMHTMQVQGVYHYSLEHEGRK